MIQKTAFEFITCAVKPDVKFNNATSRGGGPTAGNAIQDCTMELRAPRPMTCITDKLANAPAIQ